MVIVSTYPPEHCGVGRDAFQLVQSLRALREVRVVANRTGGPPLPDPLVFRGWWKDDWRYPFRIVSSVRAADPDRTAVVHVMHHFFLYGGRRTVPLFPLLVFLLRLNGYRSVVQLQSVIDPRRIEPVSGLALERWPPGIFPRLLRGFYRILGRWSDGVVVCTRSMRDILVDEYHLNARRVWIVPVGWQLSQAAPVPPLSGGDSPTSRKRALVFHGFLDPTKGLEVLLRAFALLVPDFPQLSLTFAGEVSPQLGGDGPTFVEALRQLARELHVEDRVRFTGYLDAAELDGLLRTAEIFVLPYTMRFSHGGSASLSRLASTGKPLVASRISRFADELHDGEDALLVTAGSVGELSAAIRRLLSNRELGARLGARLRELASHRTWAASAAVLDRTVYPAVVERGARPA